jgi:hypothetical protein
MKLILEKIDKRIIDDFHIRYEVPQVNYGSGKMEIFHNLTPTFLRMFYIRYLRRTSPFIAVVS